MLYEIKAGFFLLLSVAFFALICLVAMLAGLITPVRWSERKHWAA